MKRRFALPMVIAVTVEAVVLLCFNKPNIVTATPSRPPAPPPPIVVPLDDLPVDASTSDKPAGGPSPDRPAPPVLPEPPPDQPREIITIEVPIQQPSALPPDKQTTITLPNGTHDADGPAIIDIASLDNVPHARVQQPPKYPYGAIQNGQSGEVVVEFIVDFNGRVLNAHVVSSSSFIFEEPTLQAVSQWRFEPGRRYGKPVRFRMMVPVEFHLGQE
jgi:protein TonB